MPTYEIAITEVHHTRRRLVVVDKNESEVREFAQTVPEEDWEVTNSSSSVNTEVIVMPFYKE